jgi:CRP-like cAMP-binding protein
VRSDREVLRQLGPGEYFGELTALDRGAGFGCGRTASVVAKSPSGLLVLPASGLDELLRRAPDLERRRRGKGPERLVRM